MLKRDHRALMDAYQVKHAGFIEGQHQHINAFLHANAQNLQNSLDNWDMFFLASLLELD